MRPLLITAIFLVTAAAGYGESITETESAPPLETLVCGTFWSFEEKGGSYIYNVNINAGEIEPLLYLAGFDINGCSLSEDERYILTHGYYYDSSSEALILFKIDTNNEGYYTESVFEERFEDGSIITSVYVERDNCFYIAVSDRGEPGPSIGQTYDPYYKKTGKTGDTAIYKYTPGAARLDSIASVPYYLEIEADYPDPGKLHVFYEEYPYAKRLGILNTHDGTVAFIYPWSDNKFAFLNDPNGVSKDCPKRPVIYFCIPAVLDGRNDAVIAYLYYFTPSNDEAIVKIGDAILLPILFSIPREELVFLTYENGETAIRNYPLKESTSAKAIRLTRDLGSTFRLLHVE